MDNLYLTLPNGDELLRDADLRRRLPHIAEPSRLSDADLRIEGIVRAVDATPSFDPAKHRLTGAFTIDMTVTPPAVYFTREAIPVPPPPSAEVVAGELLDRVEFERDKRVAAGVSYTFPDGVSGTIQTRDEKDFRNINGVAARGLALVVRADVETTLIFRDKENVDHALTGDQAVALGEAVHARVEDIYKVAWSHKTAIQAILGDDTLAEAEKRAALSGYDLTIGWPA